MSLLRDLFLASKFKAFRLVLTNKRLYGPACIMILSLNINTSFAFEYVTEYCTYLRIQTGIMNRPMHGVWLYNRSPEQCAKTCISDTECKGYTYAPHILKGYSGYQTSATCMHKKTNPNNYPVYSKPDLIFDKSWTIMERSCPATTPICLQTTQKCAECTISNTSVCKTTETCLADNTCGPCSQASPCPSGLNCNLSTGECSNNSTPSISKSPGPTSVSLNEGTNLQSQGTYGVTDTDASDTVTVSVQSVSSSGVTLPGSITNQILKDMMTLDKTTVINSGETTGTFNWQFDSGSETFDFLQDGETLTLTYVIEVKDNKNATGTANVVITISGSSCASHSDCSTLTPICDSGACKSCTDSSITDGDAKCQEINSGYVCLTSGTSQGACGECATNDDCKIDATTSKVCDTTTNTCVRCKDGDANRQCGTGYVCDPNR